VTDQPPPKKAVVENQRYARWTKAKAKRRSKNKDGAKSRAKNRG
jgi:hypothetical protein